MPTERSAAPMREDTGSRPSDPRTCRFCSTGVTDRSPRFSSEGWSVRTCLDCTVSYVEPIPPVETLAKYYGYEEYGRPAYNRSEESTEVRTRALEGYLEVAASHGVRRGRLLDVGCSTGQMLEAARRGGWSPEGIELDPTTAAVARERHGCPVRVGAGLDSLSPGDRFDLITMSHWLEHSPEPRRQLLLARDHLSEGGAILVRVPNAGGTAAELLGWGWRWFSPPIHLFYFTERSIQTAGRDLGLEVRWAYACQGDAWPLPVELASGLWRRVQGPTSASRSVPEAEARPGRTRLTSLLTVGIGAFARHNPMRAWEGTELVVGLARGAGPYPETLPSA